MLFKVLSRGGSNRNTTYICICVSLFLCVCIYIYGCMHTWVIHMNILVVESKFFSKQKAAPETEKELEEKERIIAIWYFLPAFFERFLVANALTRTTRHFISFLFFLCILYICICMYEYIYTCRSYKIYIHLILLFGFCECHVNAGLGHVLQCNKVYGIFEFP